LRLFYLLAEWLLLLLVALGIWELQTRGLEHLFQNSPLKFKSLHITSRWCLVAQQVTYKDEPLAKMVLLCPDSSAFIKGSLLFYTLKIVDLDLNTIQRHTSRSQTSDSPILQMPPIPFGIKRLFISALYRHNGLNKATLKASDVTFDQATIDHLYIDSFAAKTEASGYYRHKTLSLKGTLQPKKGYLEAKLPQISPDSVRLARYEINATAKKLHYSCAVSAKEPLPDLNLTLKSQGNFAYATKHFTSHNTLNASFSKTRITSQFQLQHKNSLFFDGDATLLSDPYPIPLNPHFYKQLNLEFEGKPAHIAIKLSNPLGFEADGTIFDLQKIHFSTHTFTLGTIARLPSILSSAKMRLEGSFGNGRLHIQAYSDIADATISYKKPILRLTAHPKPYRHLALFHLSPLTLTFHQDKKRAALATPLFKAQADLHPPRSGTIIAGKNRARLLFDRNITLKATIVSIGDLLSRIQKITPLNTPKISGAGTLSLHIDPKHLAYGYSVNLKPLRVEDFTIDFAKVMGKGREKNLTISYYGLYFLGHSLYSTKPSTISFGDKTTTLSLWLYDTLALRGWYGDKKGSFTLTGKDFSYSSVEGVARLDVDLDLSIDPDQISTEGSVTLHEGNISYIPRFSTTISDPDIVVVDAPQKKPSFFKEQISLSVKVEGKKPILYQNKELRIHVVPDLTLWKERQKDLQLLGLARITKGYYTPMGEWYEFLPGNLYFYDRPSNPYLDLHIKTMREPYIIYITITGTATNPVILLDSSPPLPPEQILSLLLFGSGSSSILKAITGNVLAGAFGGLFFKQILATLGLSIDTLSLTSGTKGVGIEIGKRIGKKLMVIYKNDEVSTIILRYQINDKIESEVIFGPQKSGASLFYRSIW
jgi:translocation and assembly module TamB